MSRKILILALLLFPVAEITAYSPQTTHRGLAEQSVAFYNQNFYRKISDKEKELIIAGAADEDSPVTRSLNHFYDPVRNIGINNYRSAKDWATFSDTGNIHTWDSAIKDYSEGREEDAFISLGHIIHLVEDMTVPDHTRNDPHMGVLGTGESSYEKWTKITKDRATLAGLAESYGGLKPLIFQDILEYFDFLANYSNKNFFGDDSINNSAYQYEFPKISRTDKRFAYAVNFLDGKEYPILNFRIDRLGEQEFFIMDDERHDVVEGYFDRLGKQAILAGAGVIDLFIREGETARAEYLKKQSEIAKREIQKILEVDKKLQSLNILELIAYGANSIWEDNVTSPIQSKVSLATDSFKSGAKVAQGTIKSVGGMVSFTGSAIAKEAMVNISKIFASPENTMKNVIAVSHDQNMPNISLAIKEAMESVNVPGQVPTSNAENTNIIVTTKQPNYFAELNLAESQLLSLINLIPKPTPVSAPVVSAYSPGFGGGESPKPSVDKPVDNSSEEPKELIIEPIGASAASAEVTAPVLNQEPEPALETSLDLSSPAEEEPEILLPIIDIVHPSVFLHIDSCEDSLAKDICLVATTTIKISWGSESEDVSFFETSLNGGKSTTTETSAFFELQDKTINNFSVSAIDINDNQSDPASKSFEIFLNPIIINEVAWGGTQGHPEDEWIELRNLSNYAISLDGWNLYSQKDNSPNIILSGQIPPEGYYLIERRNDGEEDEETESPVKDIAADLWVSFGAGLLNSGEHLVLSRASTTIDEIPYSINWSGGEAGRSSQRILEGGVNKWSSYAEIFNGRNVSDLFIYGTPKAKNYRDYLISVSGKIYTDIVLTSLNSPYFVPKASVLTIMEGASLVIEPGVVIKMGDGASVVVNGKIISEGTPDLPVVFTSLKDDEYGGDLNNDGICKTENASSTATCPSPGTWRGIFISSKSTGADFTNTKLRYGGGASVVSEAMIYSESSSVNIKNSVFEYSGTHGAFLIDTTGIIEGNTFRKNDDTSKGTGIKVSGGSPVIRNNVFVSNSTGIYMSNSGADVLDNYFDGNALKGMDLYGPVKGSVSGNRSSGSPLSRKNMINLSGTISYANSTTTLTANPMPYFISGRLQVSASSTLHIYEGAKLFGGSSGEASSVIVSGEMSVFGTEDNPVIFASNMETPTKTGWGGIVVNESGRVDMKNAIIKDATTGISYTKSPIILENVLFSNNQLGIKSAQAIIEKAIGVTFGEGNTATTSPKGIF